MSLNLQLIFTDYKDHTVHTVDLMQDTHRYHQDHTGIAHKETPV
jgi:hypothetical protein